MEKLELHILKSLDVFYDKVLYITRNSGRDTVWAVHLIEEGFEELLDYVLSSESSNEIYKIFRYFNSKRMIRKEVIENIPEFRVRDRKEKVQLALKK